MQRWIFLYVALVVGCTDKQPAQPDAPAPAVDAFDTAKRNDAAIDAPAIDAAIDAPMIDAPPGSCPANTWCLETTTIGTTKLNGVFALTADDVFAVGVSGTILRRVSGTWTTMTSNTTSELRGVWAASASDAWAVGASGTILRWNGSTWASAGAPTTTTTFEAVWGSSATDVWAVGGTSVYRYDGSGWTVTGRPGNVLLDVTGTGPNDVWVTGELAYIQRWNGTAWSTNTSNGIGSDFFAIHAISTSNVWVSSGVPSKQTANWTGTTWSPQAVSATIVSLWGSGASDLWGVGLLKIVHWTGAAWSIETPSIITANLRAVSGSGTNVWVVGDGGTIAHRHQ